jgi:hypothetical protein
LSHHYLKSGYRNAVTTLKVIKFYIGLEGMANEVQLFVNSCPICRFSKPVPTRPKGFLKPVATPVSPGLDLSIDILSGLPPLRKRLSVLVAVLVDRICGYMFANIFIDYLTSYSLFRFVIDSCVTIFGSLLHSFLSDRGPEFWSCIWFNLLSAS